MHCSRTRPLAAYIAMNAAAAAAQPMGCQTQESTHRPGHVLTQACICMHEPYSVILSPATRHLTLWSRVLAVLRLRWAVWERRGVWRHHSVVAIACTGVCVCGCNQSPLLTVSTPLWTWVCNHAYTLTPPHNVRHTAAGQPCPQPDSRARCRTAVPAVPSVPALLYPRSLRCSTSLPPQPRHDLQQSLLLCSRCWGWPVTRSLSVNPG